MLSVNQEKQQIRSRNFGIIRSFPSSSSGFFNLSYVISFLMLSSIIILFLHFGRFPSIISLNTVNTVLSKLCLSMWLILFFLHLLIAIDVRVSFAILGTSA